MNNINSTEDQKTAEASNPLECLVMPIQPIQKNTDGVVRFVPNRIVEKLLDAGHIDMNDITMMDFTDQERMQFAQLIGYSVSGFGSLSYVDDETYESAVLMSDDAEPDETAARNEALREKLHLARKGIKQAATALFEIFPDDLEA